MVLETNGLRKRKKQRTPGNPEQSGSERVIWEFPVSVEKGVVGKAEKADVLSLSGHRMSIYATRPNNEPPALG
jgi:hypothetical protein